MINKQTILDAADKVLHILDKMNPEELNEALQSNLNGPIAHALSGALGMYKHYSYSKCTYSTQRFFNKYLKHNEINTENIKSMCDFEATYENIAANDDNYCLAA